MKETPKNKRGFFFFLLVFFFLELLAMHTTEDTYDEDGLEQSDGASETQSSDCHHFVLKGERSRLCAQSWLRRHPAKMQITGSSRVIAPHQEFFFFAKIMIFLDF